MLLIIPPALLATETDEDTSRIKKVGDDAMFLPSALTSSDYSCHVWWCVRPSRGGFKRRPVVSNVELLPFGTAVARRLKRPLCIAISPYKSRIRIVLRQTTTDKVNMKLKAKKSTSNVNLSKTEDFNSSVKCFQASAHTFGVKEIGRTSDKNQLASRRPIVSSFPIFIIISLFSGAQWAFVTRSPFPSSLRAQLWFVVSWPLVPLLDSLQILYLKIITELQSVRVQMAP